MHIMPEIVWCDYNIFLTKLKQEKHRKMLLFYILARKLI